MFSTETEPSFLIYKKVGGADLQLHVFKPKGLKPGGNLPCIVFFFGGGWKVGTPVQFYPQSRYLASRGMIAISAEYRVESRHGTTPADSVADGKSAIRFIRQHARELGVDPDRIVGAGSSAGGQVAAAAALVTGFDDPSDHLEVSCRPNVLVLINPVIDNGPEGYGYDRVKEYWKNFSPLHNLFGGGPPTVILIGTQDKLIPVSTVKTYQNKMREAGCRCDLHLYTGQPHAFFNYRENEENPYFYATTYALDEFLVSLGYLKGKPALENRPVHVTSS